MKAITRYFSIALLLALFSANGFAKTCSAVGGAILTNLGGFMSIINSKNQEDNYRRNEL